MLALLFMKKDESCNFNVICGEEEWNEEKSENEKQKTGLLFSDVKCQVL